MSALPSTTTFDDYLNEQLINCLNLQTNVIQNLGQYSQHISLQLIEIKNNVNILTNRVLTLQQQSYIQIPPPPPSSFNPLLFYQPPPSPFSFSLTTDEPPSRDAPFIFDSIGSNHLTSYSYDDDDDDDDDSYEPTMTFQSNRPLPTAEVKTGEDDENILFCERATLYRFDFSTNEMKERGTGELKILQHQPTHVCRILMRQEHILKVCANHTITSHMELKPHQGTANAYLWSAIDFADGEAKHEVFCVKFTTDEQTKSFVKIFNQSKEIIGDLLSIGKISLDDNDVIPIGEIKPTVEQIERAKKLQLPLTFYLYENKEPCKGCRGCREDVEFTNRMNSYNTPTPAIISNFPSTFFPNSSLPSLMSMVPTWLSDGVDSFPSSNQMPSPPKDYRMIIKAKRSLPSNRLPPPPLSSLSYSNSEQTFVEVGRGDEAAAVQAHQKKSRNFSGNKTESRSFNDYATQTVENILDQVKQELHKQIVTTNKPSISPNSGFSFTNFGTTTDFQFSSKPADTSSTFTFGNKPKLTFSDLVKQSSPTTNDTEERVFPGQGSLVFGANTTDDGDADEPYEPTITFKPIVKLYPVETKTGEEDENILFCEHAKLYRFDSLTNEMKERGIGEMKILQHKTTHVCRVLMRQEQVLKVRANHKITPEMELKPHLGSDRAYVWSAIDYADREAKHETLCVKFKTSDIAKRFFQQFNDAKMKQ